MPSAFDYSIVRVVPSVEREEFINVGAIVFCPDEGFLAARIELDEHRLLSLFPDADVSLLRAHLEAIVRVCEGGEGSGPIGELPVRERWHWLTSPKNTVVQTSPAHSGLTNAPADILEHLLNKAVRLRSRERSDVRSE